MVFKGVLKEVEKSLGLPKLSDATEVFKNLPDEKKMRLIRDILADVRKLKGSPEELSVVYLIIKIIAEADMEHLNAVKEITANLVRLSRSFPKEVLANLPVAEIAAEIKKRLGEQDL